MDRTNARSIEREMFQDNVDFLTADLSFVSILKIFETLQKVFASMRGVFLLKPQFEAAPGEHVKGVVRKKEIHADILNRVIGKLQESGVYIAGVTWSPVKGPAGNIEFLVHFNYGIAAPETVLSSTDISLLVEDAVMGAHEALNG